VPLLSPATQMRIADILRSSLKLAGEDAAALYPAGQKTNEAAKKEITRLAEDRYVNLARADFKALQEGTPAPPFAGVGFLADDDPRTITSAMRRSLAAAHEDASALDPTGQRTAAEMERQIAAGVVPKENITEAERQRYIATARSELDMEIGDLKTGIGSPDIQVRHIRDALTRAEVDASVLDPGGKHSPKEMNAFVQGTYRQANIVRAREELDYLQHGVIPGGADRSLKEIRDDLAKAGATAAELDPEGKRSAAEMDATVQDAYKQANIERTQFEKGDMSYEMKGTGLTIGEWERKKMGIESSHNIRGKDVATDDSITHGLASTASGVSFEFKKNIER
jgi:hypothetical protein